MNLSTGKALFFVLQLVTIAYMATDIYIPSLPALEKELNTSSDLAQLSISVYLAALGISQFIHGILSDRFGRKPTILYGLVISIIGSGVCTLAPSIHWLLVGRVIQGLGLGFSISVGRSIVPDVFREHELIKVSSIVAMSIPLVMMIAPVLGGYIQHYFGWRTSFGVLSFYFLILFVLIFRFFPETNSHVGAHRLNLKTVGSHYLSLLTSPLFLGYTICFSATLSGFIAYITVSPFLLQNLVGLTPVQYGWTIVAVGASGIVGGYLNIKVVAKTSILKTIVFSGVGMLISGIWMAMDGLFLHISLFSILVPFMLYMIMARMTTTNSYLEGAKPFRHIMGTASTIFGGVQLLLGSIVSSAITLLPHTNQLPLGLVLIALATLSLAAVQLTQLKSKKGESIE